MSDEESPEPLQRSIKASSDNEFFNYLEGHVEHPISIFTRNVLMLNGYNTVNTLSLFNEASFVEIEDFMRQEFIKSMLNDDAVFANHYGKFAKIPKNFTLVGGERRNMLSLAKACANLCVTKSHENKASEQSTTGTEEGSSSNAEIILEKLDQLRDSLFSWMSSHNDLKDIPKEEFHFKYNTSSYTNYENGSISVWMKSRGYRLQKIPQRSHKDPKNPKRSQKIPKIPKDPKDPKLKAQSSQWINEQTMLVCL